MARKVAVMSVVAKTTIFRYDNLGNSLGVLDYDEATHEEDLDGLDTLTVNAVMQSASANALCGRTTVVTGTSI